MGTGKGMKGGGRQAEPSPSAGSGGSARAGAVEAGHRGASQTLIRAAMTGLLRIGLGAGLGAGAFGGLAACDASSSSPATATAGSAATAAPHVTSTEVVPNLSLEQFTQMCDAVGGTVETIPHCGGLNTCKGFAYDLGPQVLTQHTCKATNTCAGWNCIVPG
jgi:hypothetical protein